MPRVIRPPEPPHLPAKLPFEDRVDASLTRLAQRMERSPAITRLQAARDRFPEVASVEIPTPLGTFVTPHFALPEATPPKIDARRREIVKAAALDDLAGIIAFVPVVGDIISDPIEDTAMAKVHDTLTPQEKPIFQNADKALPLTVLSALYTFAKVR